MKDIANLSSFGARAIAGTSPLFARPVVASAHDAGVKQHKRR
jgi:hypothetical protein